MIALRAQILAQKKIVSILYTAALCFSRADQKTEKCGFAATIGTADYQQITSMDLEGEFVEKLQLAKAK